MSRPGPLAAAVADVGPAIAEAVRALDRGGTWWGGKLDRAARYVDHAAKLATRSRRPDLARLLVTLCGDFRSAQHLGAHGAVIVVRRAQDEWTAFELRTRAAHARTRHEAPVAGSSQEARPASPAEAHALGPNHR